VEHVVQPAYDSRLSFLLTHPATAHLGTVDEVLAFSAGVGVVWYDCPTHVFNHDQMRSIASFFGLWHEGGRAGRDGVTELWWYGSAKLFLVNVYKGLPILSMPVSGTVESSSLKDLRPPSARVIPWSEFTPAVSRRPPLTRHTGLYGMRISSPLAHVNGGNDANGPPDTSFADSGDSSGGGGSLARAALPDVLLHGSGSFLVRRRGRGEGGGGHPRHHAAVSCLPPIPAPAAAAARERHQRRQ
jgi:hypothetical protein